MLCVCWCQGSTLGATLRPLPPAETNWQSSMLILQSCMHHDRVMPVSPEQQMAWGCFNMAPHSCISLNRITHTQLSVVATL